MPEHSKRIFYILKRFNIMKFGIDFSYHSLSNPNRKPRDKSTLVDFSVLPHSEKTFLGKFGAIFALVFGRT